MSKGREYRSLPMTETTDHSAEGPLLKNRYRLGRVLGRGGMCIVYQAWDTRLERNVAVKRLEPSLNEDPRTRARFDREGRALAQLSHPNLVTLIDRGSTDTEEYLVFEYVEGRSLKEATREGPLPVAQVGSIAGQVAEGLAAAHLAGIIHRDVKPQNILIDRQGHAKVTDFGIATGPDWTRVTRAGSIIGSARYMSPEQIRSKPVDARSDVYSLGVVIYEMLAGHPPFDGTNMPEIARQHLNSTPPPLSEARADLPPGLERVVMRCLEKLPEDRFVSMDELLGALVGLGLHSPQLAPEIATSHRRLRRHSEEEGRGRALASPGGATYDSGSRRPDESTDSSTTDRERERERARALARRRRTTQRVKIGGWLAAVVVVIVIAVVLATALSGSTAPSVVGLSLDQAQKAAEAAGFKVDVADTDQVPSFDKPAGTVLEQDPALGGKSDDDTLHLTVTRTPIAVKVSKVQDIDPEGDARENPDLLVNLTDGKRSTGWTTELYKSSSFGSTGKTGLGLDFTLDEPATMIEITSAVEGWSGELLQNVSSGPGARLATLDGKSTQIVTLRQALTSCRFWITELTKLTDTRWGVDLSEVEFYR
jgi:serine/threonine protein kinase